MPCPDCKNVRGKFTLCEKHETEWQETHKRWHAEHAAEIQARANERSLAEATCAEDLL
jgi:hypothetical protein